MNTLKIGDPVTVDQKSANVPPLQGVVSYLGPVDFAEGDDWIGVRLTGDSVGKGKNDGTVQGKKYFEDCPPNGGMFVRASHVHKRILSKLEELRLKRELKGMGPVTASSSAKRSTPVSKSASGDDDDSSVSSMRSSATGASNRSRLDEIRQRRMELQRSKNKLLSPPPKNIIAAKTKSSTVLSAETIAAKTEASSKAINNQEVSPRTSAKKSARTTTTSTPLRSDGSPLKPKQEISSPSNTRALSLEVNQLKEKVQELSLELENKENLAANLRTELEMKDSSEKAAKAKLQSLFDELTEKENETKNLQNRLRDAEQSSHDVKLALEESKAEVAEMKRKLDSVLNDAKNVTPPVPMVGIDEVMALKEEIAELRATNEILDKEKLDLEEILSTTQRQNSSLRHELEREREMSSERIQTLQNEIVEAKSKASMFEKELSQTTEKAALREDNNAVHYKEKAKLQAEIQSWQRKVQELEKEKIEANNAFEDLTLDKEQLLEKLESLEDKVEELKIDAESAQIEVDELRMELEDARERAEKAEAAASIGSAGGSYNDDIQRPDSDEVTQALSLQNSRLREAIIRLREQSAIEKMELSRQLRAAEKDASIAVSLKEEVSKLLANEKIMKEEIKELKEMVDQGSAFEQMVEDLSERVLAVEDNNIALQSTIREMEEGAELSAEMEEAQADEIKMLMNELQNRDTIVVNLEQAIKMQRRRELDFQRTISNFRVIIETLQKERDAVLNELGDRDGATEDAMLTTQKALAQAAQSVADAALARKNAAEASFNLIDAQVKSHLAERLENFLPQGVASSEITAVKGELLLSKVAMKAASSLSSIHDIFQKIRNQARELNDTTDNTIIESDTLSISSALAQNIGTMIHQAKFSRLAIEISSECITLLSAGQWPSLLSYDTSIDLGIVAAQAVPSLDNAISEQLFLLKKEGNLSPHQSNLNTLEQNLELIRSSFKAATNVAGSVILPSSWMPPGLSLSKSFTLFKFNCLGVGAILGAIVTDDGDKMRNGISMLKHTVATAEKLCNEISVVFQSISSIDVTDSTANETSLALVQNMLQASDELFKYAENFCASHEIQSSSISELDSKLVTTSNALMRMHSFLRSQQTGFNRIQNNVLLSPECADPWKTVVEVVSKAQSNSEDSVDLNYLIRSRKLEEELSIAVENDAKLSIANAKIKSLEKNLVTRSNEISLQNARLEELERLLAQVDQNSNVKHKLNSETHPVVVQELKEEIRVLNEAMEVLQGQVDAYEQEIRSLKDQSARNVRYTPNSTGKGSIESFSLSSSLGISSPQKIRNDHGASSLSLESALFRPALQSALSDASIWKSKVMFEKLIRLPSLSKETNRNNTALLNQNRQLTLARADVRHIKASVEIIRLNESSSNATSLLCEKQRKTLRALRRFEALTETTRLTTAASVA